MRGDEGRTPHLPPMPKGERKARSSARILAGLKVNERVRHVGELEEPGSAASSEQELTASAQSPH